MVAETALGGDGMTMQGYNKAWIALGLVTALFLVVLAVDVAIYRLSAEKVFERLENDPSYCGMKVTVGGRPMALVAISYEDGNDECPSGLFLRRDRGGLIVFGTTSDGLRFEQATKTSYPHTFYGLFRAINGGRADSFVPSFEAIQDLERSKVFYPKYSAEKHIFAVFGTLIFLPFSIVCIVWQLICWFLQKRRKIGHSAQQSPSSQVLKRGVRAHKGTDTSGSQQERGCRCRLPQ